MHIKNEILLEAFSIRRLSADRRTIAISPELEKRYIESLDPDELIKLQIESLGYAKNEEKGKKTSIDPEAIEALARQIERVIQMKNRPSSQGLSGEDVQFFNQSKRINLDTLINLPDGKPVSLSGAPQALRQIRVNE